MKPDEQEFAALIREHGALVERIARAHEHDHSRAEELVQDIHLAIWQALPRFRGEANIRTYIARVAQNRAVSHVARESRRPPATPLEPLVNTLESNDESPADAAVKADQRRRLERAVRELPAGLKLTVTLALEGFSPSEIADVLGISTSAASVRLHRAKTTLQDKLTEVRT